MTSALSNPYELTVDGITCKSSPYSMGYYVSENDLNNLSPEDAEKFKKGIFRLYHAEHSKVLNGIKVLGLKKTPHLVNPDTGEEITVTKEEGKHHEQANIKGKK